MNVRRQSARSKRNDGYSVRNEVFIFEHRLFVNIQYTCLEGTIGNNEKNRTIPRHPRFAIRTQNQFVPPGILSPYTPVQEK